MKKLFALLAALLLATSAWAQAPFDFPANPTLNQIVTVPGGLKFQWDGTKWIATASGSGNSAPEINPPGGVNNYAPISGPHFSGNTVINGNLDVSGITTHQSAVIPTLAVTTNLQIASPANLLFDGFPMGGTCPAGEFVNALSAIGKLTCAAAAGGGSFLPLAGGTMTGVITFDVPTSTSQLRLSPMASIWGYSATVGVIYLQAGAHRDAGWIADATQANEIQVGSGGLNGGFSFMSNTGLTPGNSYTKTTIAVLDANGWDIRGVAPTYKINGVPIGGGGLPVDNPTYTGVMTGPMGPTALRVGDMAITSSSNGNYNLTAGVTFNGTNWISATGGPFTLLNSNGNQIGFFTALARAVGQPIPGGGWFPRMRVDATGVLVSHLVNLPMASLPMVQNGTLMAGSQDSFGYILASAWPVTLHFAYLWQASPACVATGAAAAPGVYYTNAQTTGQIEFGCVNYVGGPICAPGWFAYHCGDVGP